MNFRELAARFAGRTPTPHTAVVDGDEEATNIPVTGIKLGDFIESVIEVDTGVPADRTSEGSISSDGNIQLSTTDTTGNKLIVRFWSRS